MARGHDFEALALGGSAGALEAMRPLLRALTPAFPLPLVVLLHTPARPDGMLAEVLQSGCALPVGEAMPLQPITPGRVYVAPGGYHLLVERDRTFALSVDAPVQFARPALDVLFTSAAEAYRGGLIAVVLSGGNEDGARGLAEVRRRGGYAIVQDPATARAPYMPRAALERAGADCVCAPEALAATVTALLAEER